MRLNALGRASMNNAVRAGLQRRLMARWFERLGGRVPGGRGIELGCGRGAALRMLSDRFGLRQVIGLDLDPRMLGIARRRDPNAALVLADATRAPFADASFDAVFDFGAIHFLAAWERALDEVRRLLRPGGRYDFEWVTGRFLRAFYPLATDARSAAGRVARSARPAQPRGRWPRRPAAVRRVGDRARRRRDRRRPRHALTRADSADRAPGMSGLSVSTGASGSSLSRFMRGGRVLIV
jgi:SAM-dependent methyltransferase